ncbi:hypothetical protein MJO28_006534 [Puccinia striiformis f. sp. tritici]|uniref:Uncharacterized protein n=1 Tax=Puccinia striiformis f. sp. tritici TaxID=168172 RepID=A0ACC0EH52_9BASI|nr:hypothetical protein MJO28_006534 [Puccinia striiformis f. sp. tritici]
MLRYSTMSSLDWEDEQQQVLPTDPYKTLTMAAEILSNDMNTPEMKQITRQESIGLPSPLSRITSTNLPLIPTRIKSEPIIEQTRTSYPAQS